jgi:hypothetical protein
LGTGDLILNHRTGLRAIPATWQGHRRNRRRHRRPLASNTGGPSTTSRSRQRSCWATSRLPTRGAPSNRPSKNSASRIRNCKSGCSRSAGLSALTATARRSRSLAAAVPASSAGHRRQRSRTGCTPSAARRSEPARHRATDQRSMIARWWHPARHVERPHAVGAHVAERHRLDRFVDAPGCHPAIVGRPSVVGEGGNRAADALPGERGKTKPLGAALTLKAAGTALHHRPEACKCPLDCNTSLVF